MKTKNAKQKRTHKEMHSITKANINYSVSYDGEISTGSLFFSQITLKIVLEMGLLLRPPGQVSSDL
jgi:hypothetical protein